MKQKLKLELAGAQYVCTTADIWTANRKSYMGMTIHYISNGDEMSQVSAALACRRFLGSHTYGAIAELMYDIHSLHGLTIDKVTAKVTDNASNFGKAFREFLHQIPEISEAEEVQESVPCSRGYMHCYMELYTQK